MLKILKNNSDGYIENMIYSKILLLFFVIKVMKCELKCNEDQCNYEAECVLEGIAVRCDCVGTDTVFNGEICSEKVDNCLSSPCKNGGECQSFLGHYNCKCRNGFSGQDCTSTDPDENILKDLHFHYNRIATSGKKETFFVLATGIAEAHFAFEISSNYNFIAALNVQTNPFAYFKSSYNLAQLLEKFGIHHAALVPFKGGFYAMFTSTFWRLGRDSILLHVFTDEKTLYRFNFPILVTLPDKNKCAPIINIKSCSNPKKPLQVNIAVFNFFEPFVEKRCSDKSRLRFDWSISNYEDTSNDD